MKRDPASFLWDMQQACAAIRSFVDGVAPERFATDLLLRSAVERQLQTRCAAIGSNAFGLRLAGPPPA
jgi:uncharacterized protein with HEPN domain